MRVYVVGIGYVGLTLLLHLHRSGCDVFGIERDEERCERLNLGISDVVEPELSNILKNYINSGKQIYLPENLLENEFLFDEQDIVVITLGTALVEGSAQSASDSILKTVAYYVERGAKRFWLRSTVSVGLCDFLDQSYGGRVRFAFAPERTIEGAALHELNTLPQIFATPYPSEFVDAEKVFVGVKILKCSSFKEGEVTKLVSNLYRDYTFNFANLVSLVCDNLGVDFSTVNRLASFDYPRFPQMVFGPVSGPCLSKDAFILDQSLSGDAVDTNYRRTISDAVLVGRNINALFVKKIVDTILDLYETGDEIILIGLSFKSFPNTSDTRNSHAFEIFGFLTEHNIKVTYYDEMVNTFDIPRRKSLRDIAANSILVHCIVPPWLSEILGDSSFQENFRGVKANIWCYPPPDETSFGNDVFVWS
ncbi:hypothetical protein [Roseobacter sp. HKCCA0882]|uniref:hypothetical protein n=1 Tax=Roseobacter sp. HKCCA0882 TaxID=3120337 RepID=UPI0030EDC2B9